MKRFIETAGWAAAIFIWLAFAAAVVAYAQVPVDSIAPLDTTGVMAGTPNTAGGWIIGLAQLIGGIVFSFGTAKLLALKNKDGTQKWPWFTGWLAASGVGVFVMFFTGLFALVADKVGLESGVSFSWLAFATALASNIWFHISKPNLAKAMVAIPPPMAPVNP